MKEKFKRIIVILYFINLAFLLLWGKENQAKESRLLHSKLMFIFLDYSAISCSLCLDSFLTLCNTLKTEKGENIMVVGVIISEDSEDENRAKIIEKQLRGFAKANNIDFPLILDKSNIFKESHFEDSIILFDIVSKSVKKYKFPLDKKRLKEIIVKDK
jgi:hypothetical protein